MSHSDTESELYSLIGEADDKGNIIFVRHYRDDEEWKRKSKPLKIPAAKFWGTAQAVKNGTYTPKKVENSRIPQLSSTYKKKK